MCACSQSIEDFRRQNIQRYSPLYNVKKYNPTRVRKVKGIVIKIGKNGGAAIGTRNFPGMLMLKIISEDKKEYEVELGPDLFIMTRHASFKAGQEVVIIGDVDEFDAYIIAERIYRKNSAIILRDPTGKPLWTSLYIR